MNPTTPTIGDGTRILHFLVDTILIAFIAYSIYGWWNFHVMYWNYTPIQYGAFFFATMWAYVFLWAASNIMKCPFVVRGQFPL